MYSNKEKYPYRPDVVLGKKVLQTYYFNLSTRNIRTILDKLNSNRVDKRSTIISKVLQKYSINIVVLSEIRFAESGQDQATLSTKAGKLQEREINLVWLLRSGIVFCQVCLKIPNQLVINLPRCGFHSSVDIVP